MTSNSEQPASRGGGSRFEWRPFWKRACIGSVCLAVVLLALSATLAAYRTSPERGDWFLIVDGFLALAELVAWVFVGIAGIGWVICRRSNGDPTEP